MRRCAGFGDVALDKLCAEVADLYQPLAAEKHIDLTLQLERVVSMVKVARKEIVRPYI